MAANLISRDCISSGDLFDPWGVLNCVKMDGDVIVGALVGACSSSDLFNVVGVLNCVEMDGLSIVWTLAGGSSFSIYLRFDPEMVDAVRYDSSIWDTLTSIYL